MKNGRERNVRRILIFTLSTFLFVLIGFIAALHILIPQRIKQQLLQLPSVFQIHYSAIHTDLLATTITLNDVDVLANPNGASGDNLHRLHLSSLKLKNINFLKLAISKNLSVNSIEFDSAKIY